MNANTKLRLLLLDDDDMHLKVCEMMIKQLGYEAISCRTADDARQIFMNSTESPSAAFDVLVFDLSLGGYEDGLAVYKSIRDLHPRPKCIIVSGCLQSEPARLEVEREGCQALPKPFTRGGLSDAIGRALA